MCINILIYMNFRYGDNADHSFSQDPDIAPRNITVECVEQSLADGELPKWVWSATDTAGEAQAMIEQAIPGCIDPTYCETNPPVPSIDGVPVESSSSARVLYTKPKRGSLRFEDGEVVAYTCQNPSKL